jgi:hypothetical protein
MSSIVAGVSKPDTFTGFQETLALLLRAASSGDNGRLAGKGRRSKPKRFRRSSR